MLKVEDVKTEEMRKKASLSALQMWESAWKVKMSLIYIFCWGADCEAM